MHLSGGEARGLSEQFTAHPVQLAHVAPPEAAQEGADGGWCLGRETEHPGGALGAQHIGVVNAVAASQRRRNQGHHLIVRIGSAWGTAQVQVPVNQLGQAQVPGQRGGKEQSGISHQTAVVEG